MLSTLAATGVAFVGRGAEAQESKDVVTVQARILQNGVPVNADLNLTFEVYTASSGGTLLWSESQSNVPVRNGILAVSLGTASALGGTFKHGFNATSERWLAVKQDGVEIVPRVRLTAVPYAQAAGTAEIASSIWNGTTGTSLTLSGLVGAGLEQDGSGRLRISSSAAGNGLTGGSGSALAVGAGAGITVSADAVAVNSAALVATGAAEVDGDQLAISYAPSNYTRTDTAETNSTGELTAHLRGIDLALASGGSGTVLPAVAGGRLSAAAAAVTTQDTTSSILYYQPYCGSVVALYTGSAWVYRDIGAGLSVTVSSLNADHNYDIFMYDNSGTAALDTPVDWSVHTAGSSYRATDLALQDGVLVKAGTPTRRYLGTIRTVSSSGVKATDTKLKRFIWNIANRVDRCDTTSSGTSVWTEASTSMNALDGGNGSWKHEFVVGFHLDERVETLQTGSATASGGAAHYTNFGHNSTTTQAAGSLATISQAEYVTATNTWGHSPPSGYHYVQCLESVNFGSRTVYAAFSEFTSRARF